MCFVTKNLSLSLFHFSTDPLAQFEILPTLLKIIRKIYACFFDVAIDLPVFIETLFGMNTTITILACLFFSHLFFANAKTETITMPYNFFNFIKTSILELNITVVRNNIAIQQQF